MDNNDVGNLSCDYYVFQHNVCDALCYRVLAPEKPYISCLLLLIKIKYKFITGRLSIIAIIIKVLA